jgi:hypothetical protein
VRPAEADANGPVAVHLRAGDGADHLGMPGGHARVGEGPQGGNDVGRSQRRARMKERVVAQLDAQCASVFPRPPLRGACHGLERVGIHADQAGVQQARRS